MKNFCKPCILTRSTFVLAIFLALMQAGAYRKTETAGSLKAATQPRTANPKPQTPFYENESLQFESGDNRIQLDVAYLPHFGKRLIVSTFQNNERVLIDSIILNYEIYRIAAGDIDHNSKIDMCVGVIKPTHFDPMVRKRLFIYEIDRGHIRPLWLGSKLVFELMDFKVIDRDGKDIIRSIEECSHSSEVGRYYIGEYRWECFGLKLIRFAAERLEYENALAQF
jgi:hypothetical protein